MRNKISVLLFLVLFACFFLLGGVRVEQSGQEFQLWISTDLTPHPESALGQLEGLEQGAT